MAKKNKSGKKRVVGKVFLVIGILISMAVGSMAATAPGERFPKSLKL